MYTCLKQQIQLWNVEKKSPHCWLRRVLLMAMDPSLLSSNGADPAPLLWRGLVHIWFFNVFKMSFLSSSLNLRSSWTPSQYFTPEKGFFCFLVVLRIEPRAFTLSYTPSPFIYLFLFWDRILLSCPGWAHKCDLPVSASQSAGFIVVHHHAQWKEYFSRNGRIYIGNAKIKNLIH